MGDWDDENLLEEDSLGMMPVFELELDDADFEGEVLVFLDILNEE